MRKMIVLLAASAFTMMLPADKCHHCGLGEVVSGDKFCQQCGGKLSRIYEFSVSHSSQRLPRQTSDITTPLKLSAFGPLSLPSDECCTVVGLDVAALRSINSIVYGLGFSSFAGYSRHTYGIACSGFLLAAETFSGVAVGGLATESKRTAGLVIAGLGHSTEMLYGIQIGAVNRADEMRGVQIGLYNRAGGGSVGLQLGLFNVLGVDVDRMVPVMNVCF